MLIAGNWKMNTNLAEAERLADEVAAVSKNAADGVQVVVCPPFISLHSVSGRLAGSNVHLGAQNMHQEPEGAFTGEVSAGMLKSVGCRFVILGHSERRSHFSETDEHVNAKTRAAREHGLIPIVCVGETLEERRSGKEKDVVRDQVNRALTGVSLSDAAELVIAYEPVWAIGTGETATPDEAQTMHEFIRELLADHFGDLAPEIHILYGGSMKPSNAQELLSQKDVDGGLIGGASLKAADFGEIIRAASLAGS